MFGLWRDVSIAARRFAAAAAPAAGRAHCVVPGVVVYRRPAPLMAYSSEPALARYRPLGDWLAAQPGERVILTFWEIEQLIGQRLPPSARASNSWWMQNEQRQGAAGRVWRAAGWKLAAVDRATGQVTYVRRSEPPE